MSRRPTLRPLTRALVAALLIAALLPAGRALAADQYRRGFTPPENWQEILEQRRMVFPRDKDPLPSHWDWRAHEGVTPPRDQGDCGSCWAFAAVGEMEAKIRIHYGVELDLSEQQIVSCNPYGSGCNGGWAGSAYYVLMHHGGVLEHCMRYEGSDDVPCTQEEYLTFTEMDNWYSVANDVEQIKTAVYEHGPVCTSVDANDAWDNYGGGVIEAPGSGTNHLVLIVGWDDRLGTDGAWIVKNSWGASWGEAGYCYVAYGATNIGAGVTALQYTPPPVEVSVGSPEPDMQYFGDASVEISWNTSGAPVDLVDIHYAVDGNCPAEPVALGVPNTGSYPWTLPNVTTDRARVLVTPHAGTTEGFGFSEGEFRILGHQTRYVATDGADIPPYDAPERAARSLAAAVQAGAGRDTILVAAGDYLESGITVNSPAHIIGGWSPDFAIHDPDVHVTRLRGVTGTLRFSADAGDYCGVSGVTFHDCQGAIGAVPVNGQHGAAIISVEASPVITDCVFLENRADPGTGPGWGGAILAHGGAPVIRDCEFRGNVGSLGGALALSEPAGALVEDTAFLANTTSDSTTGFAGGAIYVTGGEATLRRVQVQANGSGRGGGLAVTGGAAVTAEGLALVANRATGGGGGAHVSAGAAVELIGGEVVGNVLASGQGAGLAVEASALTAAAVQVRQNTTPGLGGGLYGQGLTGGALENCLLSGNAALSGGGAFLSATAAFTVRNNVLVGNTGGGLYAGGAELVSDWNLAHDNTGGDFLTDPGGHDLVAAPRFADAAAGDFAPGLHSPLLDTGDPAAGQDWDGGRVDRGPYGGPHAPAAGPGRVEGLSGSVADGVVSLTWQARPEAVSYAVYRDTAAVFRADQAHLCALVDAPGTVAEDTPPAGVDWYYVVGAVATDGRAGGFSERFAAGSQSTPVGDPGLPAALAITTVAPNPFNPRTVVHFAVPRSGPVRIGVYDLRGRLVRSLQAGTLTAGRHAVVWDGTDRRGRAAAAGVYCVRLDDGQRAVTVKAVLAK
jgi:hypothetical protein